jgi:hypothetical protein
VLAAQHAEGTPSPWRVLDRGVPDYPSTGPLGVSLPPLNNVMLEPILGYNTFDVRRYKEYLQLVCGIEEPVRPRQSFVGYPIVEPFLIENKNLLDLLGTRYLFVPADPERCPRLPKGRAGSGEPGKHPGWKQAGAVDDQVEVYSFLAGGMSAPGPQFLYENEDVFPRAFMVPSASPLPERGTLKTLRESDFRKTVFLEGWSGPSGPAEGGFRPARVVDYRPNRVVVEVDEGLAGYLVLADVMYPGWTCKVDGLPAPLYRADYLFRATPLAAGAHTIVFSFAPESYRYGRLVSSGALAVLIGLTLLTGLARAFKP